MMMHKHHIIPRHMGGTDDPSNLVELTIEEHAEAHRVLYEQHGRWEDKLAWQGLSGAIGMEEALKIKLSEAGKKRMRMGNPMHDPEVAKRANNHPDRKPWNLGVSGYTHTVRPTEEWCEEISIRQKTNVIPCDCGCGKSYNAGNLKQHRRGKKWMGA